MQHGLFQGSQSIRGATPYELAFGRAYAGELCEFGEPIFGYVIPTTKATAKWKRMLFLGKADMQKAMSHLMDNQYSLQDACAESTLNGGATWHTICIVGVFFGSTKLGLEQESCQR